MSLDVTLKKMGIVEVFVDGYIQSPTILTEVFTRNITHNLTTMAEKAGIYKHLWRPHEIGIRQANQLVHPLIEGLKLLKENPELFKQYNPENGWGSYEGFVEFVEKYLAACEENPDALVEVCR